MWSAGVFGSFILEMKENGTIIYPKHRLNSIETMRYKLKQWNFNVPANAAAGFGEERMRTKR